MTMCDVCHEYHERLEAKLGTLDAGQSQIRRDLEIHIAEAHAHLVSSATIQDWDKQILNTLGVLTIQHEKLAAAVMGPMVEDFDGDVHRDAEESLMFQVRQNTGLLRELNENQIRNGDRVRIQFGPKEWSGIIVAIISAIAAIIVQL